MTKLDLTPEQRTEFLRSINARLREAFPGCAVVVAVASEETGLSMAVWAPDPELAVSVSAQVADEVAADLPPSRPGQVFS